MFEYIGVEAGGVPWLGGGPLANRPEPGIYGRMYASDEPALYKDNGAEWVSMGASEAAQSLLDKLKTMDGSGSGLDADLLDGLDSGDFARFNDERIAGAIQSSEKAEANGVGTLDTNGKQPVSQVNDTILGSLDYQGTWNAQTNTPDIGALAKTKGDFWIVSTSGTWSYGGYNEWAAKDWIVWNGGGWEKVDNTDAVFSVNSKTGAVVLVPSDIGAIGRIRDEGALLDYAPELDFLGAGVIVSRNATTGRIEITISGAAAGAATETAAGVGEIATDTELQTVLDTSTFRNFLVSAYRLRQELDRRMTPEAWTAVTFQNGWANNGSPLEVAEYRLEPGGIVRLRGSVVGSTSGTIFTLPTGYSATCGGKRNPISP